MLSKKNAQTSAFLKLQPYYFVLKAVFKSLSWLRK